MMSLPNQFVPAEDRGLDSPPGKAQCGLLPHQVMPHSHLVDDKHIYIQQGRSLAILGGGYEGEGQFIWII